MLPIILCSIALAFGSSFLRNYDIIISVEQHFSVEANAVFNLHTSMNTLSCSVFMEV